MQPLTTILGMLSISLLALPLSAQPRRWDPTNTITPEQSESGQGFGQAVAISERFIAIGRSPGVGVFDAGPARIDLYDRRTGDLLGQLDPGPENRLGISVARMEFHGDELIVGGRRVRENALGIDGLYVFDTKTRQLVRTIEPPTVLTDNARFGSTFSLTRDIAVVGAPGDSRDGFNAGAAFAYANPGWTYLGELVPEYPGDASQPDRSGFEFGVSVAALPGVLAVSAIEDAQQDGIESAGEVHLFDPVTLAWTHSLRSGTRQANGFFGFRLAREGSALYVSESGLNPSGQLFGTIGAANLYDLSIPNEPRFVRRVTGPSNNRRIFPDIAVSEGLLVVQVGGAGLGLFDFRNGSYHGFAVVPSDTFAIFPDRLRISVSGTSVIVGAPADDRLGSDTGIVFEYDTNDLCRSDLVSPFDGPDIFDLAEFIARFNANLPEADLADPIGEWNFFDVAEYLRLFNAGCP